MLEKTKQIMANKPNAGVVWTLYSLMVLLQILDGYTTYLGLQQGFVEKNPIIVVAATVFGSSVISMVVFIKLAMVAFFAFAAYKLRSEWELMSMAVAIAYYFFVCYSNASQLS